MDTNNPLIENIYFWLILIPLILSVAKQLWNFPFHYLKQFKLRTLDTELKKLEGEDSDIRGLLRTRYSEEASGVFLGKRLSPKQQKILREESERYSFPLAMLNPGWRFVKFDLEKERISINFTQADNVARIYFLGGLVIYITIIAASLISRFTTGSSFGLNWNDIGAAIIISVFVFLHVRSHIAGYNLKKHIESVTPSNGLTRSQLRSKPVSKAR